MIRLVLSAALLSCGGCNTVAVLGKDIQIVGGVVTGTAQGVQNAGQPGRQPCIRGDNGRMPAGCGG